MFSGNASAVSLSNPNSTYLFYDNFDGTQLNTTKWELIYGSYTIQDSILVLTSNVFRGISSKNTFNAPIYIESRYKHPSNYGRIGISPDKYLASNGISMFTTLPSVNVVLISSSNGVSSQIDYLTSSQDYQTRGIGFYNHTATGYENKEIIGQVTGNDPPGPYHICIVNQYNSAMYVDYILARSYTYPEPVLENWGSWISKT